MKISRKHPRFQSLIVRDRLSRAVRDGIVVPQGLIAHGRGEAFDYIIGEKTPKAASNAIMVAAAVLVTASRPVISVNGNTAALAGKDIVKLASTVHAHIEVNLFHRTIQRERRIANYLRALGARDILGVGKAARATLRGVSSSRKHIDPRGIAAGDVVLIPLEDGDRAEALEKAGKKVIAIDLNPLSRTSRIASISIVDNVVRAVPALIREAIKMRKMPPERLESMIRKFNNDQNLVKSIDESIRYLRGSVGE
ncbi:phosphopantothenate/pantothenate synthetase [Candidatus Bathyarchaeota archaeon]|nr:phosphopantothenate/pantothenate synthetase [Candidatus Bathyarchaeota archaeon]